MVWIKIINTFILWGMNFESRKIRFFIIIIQYHNYLTLTKSKKKKNSQLFLFFYKLSYAKFKKKSWSKLDASNQKVDVYKPHASHKTKITDPQCFIWFKPTNKVDKFYEAGTAGWHKLSKSSLELRSYWLSYKGGWNLLTK